MTIEARIAAFSALGEKINQLSEDDLSELSRRALLENHWFTADSIAHAFKGLQLMLDSDKLQKWISPYGNLNPEVPKIVGVIMAGNIPLVGFHDLLCVLMSGHFAAIKTSSQDTFLVKTVINWLLEIEPRFKRNLEIRERLTEIDLLIATGSDNTARYFEYYFRNHPKIIRKNRTSIAVLDGKESKEELHQLGADIFTYFGLGCRNVSKMFIPENYDHHAFFEAIQPYEGILNNNKYHNNYDYHKSILLVNGTTHLDNGFLLWQPSDALVSPISVLFTETYASTEALKLKLDSFEDKIQCIVGHGNIPFGKAQSPEVWEYADNVDTMAFLKSHIS